MATTNEHRLSEEGCRISAELALNEALRQAWLNIADSYGLLLMMDNNLSGHTPLVGRHPKDV